MAFIQLSFILLIVYLISPSFLFYNMKEVFEQEYKKHSEKYRKSRSNLPCSHSIIILLELFLQIFLSHPLLRWRQNKAED